MPYTAGPPLLTTTPLTVSRCRSANPQRPRAIAIGTGNPERGIAPVLTPPTSKEGNLLGGQLRPGATLPHKWLSDNTVKSDPRPAVRRGAREGANREDERSRYDRGVLTAAEQRITAQGQEGRTKAAAGARPPQPAAQ